MELQPGLLRDVAIFGGLSEDTLAFILDRSARVRMATGESFITEGEMGTSFFVLESGQVRVHKDADGEAVVLCEFGPGAAFGEMSLLAVRPRSATIVAIEDCVAIEITNRSLFELYEDNTEQFAMLVMNLGREVARRLWETNERLFAATRGQEE
jgi:CRP/FNR family transcriptional regulator, cyclic AMP receptor protein